MKKIGFLGLGVMGLPMALNVLKKSGYPVLGFDVAQARLDQFAAAGGETTAAQKPQTSAPAEQKPTKADEGDGE
mgnify:CR=1 FL=1